MKFAPTLAALCLLPIVALAQSTAALDGHLKTIRDTKTITIAYRSDAIPFSYQDGANGAAGYSVDLCRRVVGSIEAAARDQRAEDQLGHGDGAVALRGA